MVSRNNTEVIEAKRGGALHVVITLSKQDGDLVEVHHEGVYRVVVGHDSSLRVEGDSSQRMAYIESYKAIYAPHACAGLTVYGQTMKRRKVKQPVVSESPGDISNNDAD